MQSSKAFVARKSAGGLRPFALIILLFAAAAGASAQRFDKEALLRYVIYVEEWPADAEVTADAPHDSTAFPGLREVTVRRTRSGRVVAERRYFLSNDGQRFFKADVFEIGQAPFGANLERLKKADVPSTGPAGASVRLDVFADFQCPDCAAEAPTLRQYIPQEFAKSVKIEFHDYPLVQHKWALNAAIAGRCAYHVSTDLYLKFQDWVYAHQKEITEENADSRMAGWASDVKAGPVFNSCVGIRATEPEVKDSLADGLALGIPGTPTLFLNGRQVPMDTDWPALKAMIQYELKATPPEDACCTVSPR